MLLEVVEVWKMLLEVVEVWNMLLEASLLLELMKASYVLLEMVEASLLFELSVWGAEKKMHWINVTSNDEVYVKFSLFKINLSDS